MHRNSYAPGKIVLSGEYAVLFGSSGIAVPSSHGVTATFEEDPKREDIDINWEAAPDATQYVTYVEKIVALCRKNDTKGGKLTVRATLPIGKGMGSSTALVVAVVRALLGDVRETALRIENTLSPGNSGFDFAVIWQGAPILYRKGEVQPIGLPAQLLQSAVLIDTGAPGESTNELVAWMRGREADIREPLKVIASCTGRLMRGEPFDIIMREHHKAQVALGVVPPEAQQLIAAIEAAGGAGKVVGAGSRTGGAGMVLAIGDREEIVKIAGERSMPTMEL